MMRKKIASPALSQRSPISPQLSWRSNGSPYLDLCPPTPQWGTSPSLGTVCNSPVIDHAAESQIAWAAYQGCSRRMNGACIVNRAQALEEQRLWWEETSSICRNAILLHSATLNKQYNIETAKNLELLENAYHIVQTMLDGLQYRQSLPIDEITPPQSLPELSSSADTLFDTEIEPQKRPPKRLGLSSVFSRRRNHTNTKAPRAKAEALTMTESLLY